MTVRTVVANGSDAVSVRITAPVEANISVMLTFCGASSGEPACDWDSPFHNTTVLRNASGRLDLARRVDFDRYSVSCEASSGSIEQHGAHVFVFRRASAVPNFDLTCRWALLCCLGDVPSLPDTAMLSEPVPTFDDALQVLLGAKKKKKKRRR